MKTLLFILTCCLLSTWSFGQINLKDKIRKKATQRVDKRTDQGVEKGLDITEEGIKGIFKKDGDNNQPEKQSESESDASSAGMESKGRSEATTHAPQLSWSKYDFVPGDKIIFEDNLIGEENGEFPSRWDLRAGNAEIAEVNDENVIMMRSGHPEIIPYLKNPGIDYLPDVFTIEFDLYYPGDGMFHIYLFDRKNQKMSSSTGYTYLDVRYDEITMGQVKSKYPDKNLAKSRWMHIAIAYNRGQLKAYMDEVRLINIPHLDFNPSGLSLYTYHASNDNIYYIKNIRIAEGGVKYYDRFLQDGKIVSNGIRFDVGKASLRPESMGVLNEIYKMLAEHHDVNVRIEGHTDSDGDNDLNQKLSEDRAETVMKQLVSMGIAAGRLSSGGFGESKPVNTNATPEGKAENRRVEFVRTN